jgi:chromosome partitioning protein
MAKKKSTSEKAKVLACVNLKGGVGKTTLAVNLAAWAAHKGLKTLLVDLDPQTNASFACLGVDGWKSHAETKGTVADLFGTRSTTMIGKAKTFKQVVAKNIFDLANLDLVPSHLDLFTIDLDIGGRAGREIILRKALADATTQYDLIIFDSPPNLTIPTQNAIAACTNVVIPVSVDFLSALGIALLKERVKSFCDSIDHTVEISGIALTRVGRAAEHRAQVEKDIKDKFKTELFRSRIKDRASVDNFTSKRKAVVLGPISNPATSDFVALSTEILQKLGLI